MSVIPDLLSEFPYHHHPLERTSITVIVKKFCLLRRHMHTSSEEPRTNKKTTTKTNDILNLCVNLCLLHPVRCIDPICPSQLLPSHLRHYWTFPCKYNLFLSTSTSVEYSTEMYAPNNKMSCGSDGEHVHWQLLLRTLDVTKYRVPR